MTHRRHFREVMVVVFLFLSTQAAYAWPPTFGPEFTFTDPTLRGIDDFQKALNYKQQKKEQFAELMRKQCKNRCYVDEEHFKVTVYYPKEDFYFKVLNDTKVLEANVKPLGSKNFRKVAPILESDLFESMKTIGMNPDFKTGLGGGHIHLGILSTFGEDAAFFRNFIAEYSSHPEVTRIFGQKPNNAPALVDLEPSHQAELSRILEEFDLEPTSIKKLAEAIQNRVYKTGEYPQKFQALNLTKIIDPMYVHELKSNQSTLEVRSLFPQSSMEEFLLEIEFLEKWAKNVQQRTKSGEVIAFTPKQGKARLKNPVESFQELLKQLELQKQWPQFENHIAHRISFCGLSESLARVFSKAVISRSR